VKLKQKLQYRAKVIILMLMKTPNSKSQKIGILHEINKKRILNTEMSAL